MTSPGLEPGIQMARSLGDGSDEIHFPYKRPVLNAFVQLLVTGQPPTPSKLKLNHLRSLITLLKELRCHQAMQACLNALDAYADDADTDPYYAFLTGAEHERWHTCALALTQYSRKEARHKIWRKHQGHQSEIDEVLGCVIGSTWVDPFGMPYHLWQRLPKKCLWALVRACTKTEDWKERGQIFENLMTKIEGE